MIFTVNKPSIMEEEVFTRDGLFEVQSFEAPVDDKREVISVAESGVEKLYNKAVELNDRCKDYTISKANINNIMFKDSGLFSFKPDGQDSFIKDISISEHALGQICAKLGVPKKYIERCLKEDPILATENINSWLETYDKGLFIRCHDDNIRGVLSPKYSVFDTPDILKGLSDVYDFSDFTVKGSYVSPERFHARIVMPRTLDIPMEDDLMPGIQIDSSDVGRSILTVKFLIYKQVCTNGLVVSTGGGVLFSQKHIGISSNEFVSEFKRSIENIPMLIEHSEELISEAKSNSLGTLQKEQMLTYIEDLQKKANIPEESAKRVMNIVKSEVYGAPTRWTLINALTQEAQNFTLEKRLEVENFAGKLLSVT